MIYSREEFGPATRDWLTTLAMINAHLLEVRGIPGDLALDRYLALQRDGRLIWITARSERLVGFSAHYWFRDLHFPLRVGQDTLWHVLADHRGQGIGRRLKEMGIEELRKAGCAYTSDLLRAAFSHDDLMLGLGYHRAGTIWRKPLT